MPKIKRAIILAGGRGNRLRPYTNATPKPLLPVGNKPIIEYAIEALLQKGINDITVITGYRASQFNYLANKYSVTLRRNKDFNNGSNLLSIKCALDKLDDCVILDGDIIIKPSAILNEVDYSTYSYVKEKYACEWSIDIEDDVITHVTADLTEKHDFNALHSISYWVGQQAKMLRNLFEQAKDDVNYYDDIAITIPNLHTHEMKHDEFIEIDTVEDYEQCLKNYGRN